MIKTSQNTPIDEINILDNPNTETMMFRYMLATSYCKGASVGDISCGYGYGTAILKALGATNAVGYDIDEEALKYCRENYPHIEYKSLDVTKPTDEPANQFDTVISIETFEHIPRETIPQYLKTLVQLVKPGGTIFITTPRRLAKEWVYNGGTHLWEYSPDEFRQEIMDGVEGDYKFFGIHEVRGQAPYNQLHSVLTDDIEQCRVMCATITVEK